MYGSIDSRNPNPTIHLKHIWKQDIGLPKPVEPYPQRTVVHYSSTYREAWCTEVQGSIQGTLLCLKVFANYVTCCVPVQTK